MIKELELTEINSASVDLVSQAHKALKASSDEVKELLVKLSNTKGEEKYAMEIAKILHSDTKVIPVTEAVGTQDVSGSLVMGAGYPGRRSAASDATFLFNPGEPYKNDIKAEELDSLDYSVYDTLSKMTGKPKKILELIKKGGVINSAVAKNCNLINKISGFENAFSQSQTRGRKAKVLEIKTEDNITIFESENAEKNNALESSGNKAEATAKRTRNSKSSTSDDKSKEELSESSSTTRRNRIN